MPSNSSLMIEQRWAKHCRFQLNMSVRQTAEVMKTSKSKVQRLCAMRNIVPKKRTAKKAPPLRTPRSKQYARFNIIKRLLAEKSPEGVGLFESAPAISREAARRQTPVGCPQTVRNTLRGYRYASRVRPLCPRHKATDPSTRLAFCKKELRVRRGAGFRNLLFSDEKNFDLNDHTARREWVAPGKKASKRPRERYAGTVMIWGVIGIGYRDIVVFPVTKKTKKSDLDHLHDDGEKKVYRLNTKQYLHKCLYPRVKRWRELGRTFQYDGASCHRAKKALRYLSDQQLPYISDWPPRSCDLNPIENFWSELQRLVAKRGPSNVTQLCQFVKEEFFAAPQQHVDNTCLSYRNKLKKCISRRGKA